MGLKELIQRTPEIAGLSPDEAAVVLNTKSRTKTDPNFVLCCDVLGKLVAANALDAKVAAELQKQAAVSPVEEELGPGAKVEAADIATAMEAVDAEQNQKRLMDTLVGLHNTAYHAILRGEITNLEQLKAVLAK